MFIAIVVVLANLAVDLLYASSTRASATAAPDGHHRRSTVGDRRSPTAPAARAGPARSGCFVPEEAAGRGRRPAGGSCSCIAALFADALATHDPIATVRASVWRRRAPSTGWAPTTSAATSTAASCTARAISLVVGLASTLLGAVLGGLVGLLSGYAGGKTDLIAQRVMDILQALPHPGAGPRDVRRAGPVDPQRGDRHLGGPIVPRAARVVRASVLSIREMQYVEAARALGAAPRSHRLPPHPAQHVRALHRAGHRPARRRHPGRGRAVLPRPRRARALSVVGPHALGLRRGVRAEGAVARALPGLAISLAVFGSNLLGDALRDTLDPRLRG